MNQQSVGAQTVMGDENKVLLNKDPESPKGFLLLAVLLRWWRFVVINTVVAALIAVIVSLLLPKWYNATARLLPPKEGDPLGGIGEATSLLKGLALGGSLGGLGGSEGSYNYFAILNSRAAMESVVREFNLREVYDVADTSIDDAIKELSNNVLFEFQDEGYISIEVLDKDPQRAADMANHFVKILNEISFELGTQEARNNRDFIGKRLLESEETLRRAEDSLLAYQEASGIIVSPDPSSIGDSPASELYAMKARKEIELAILVRSSSQSNPLVDQLQLELSEINKQLAQYPIAGIASLRLFRNILVQQKLLEFLVPMYEQARIEEQKDVPVLLILDKAVPPERKVRPQRVLIVFLTTALTLFAVIPMVFFLDRVRSSMPAPGTFDDKARELAEKIARKYKIRTELQPLSQTE